MSVLIINITANEFVLCTRKDQKYILSEFLNVDPDNDSESRWNKTDKIKFVPYSFPFLKFLDFKCYNGLHLSDPKNIIFTNISGSHVIQDAVNYQTLKKEYEFKIIMLILSAKIKNKTSFTDLPIDLIKMIYYFIKK